LLKHNWCFFQRLSGEIRLVGLFPKYEEWNAKVFWPVVSSIVGAYLGLCSINNTTDHFSENAW
jgi:hypothetical protein